MVWFSVSVFSSYCGVLFVANPYAKCTKQHSAQSNILPEVSRKPYLALPAYCSATPFTRSATNQCISLCVTSDRNEKEEIGEEMEQMGEAGEMGENEGGGGDRNEGEAGEGRQDGRERGDER